MLTPRLVTLGGDSRVNAETDMLNGETDSAAVPVLEVLEPVLLT